MNCKKCSDGQMVQKSGKNGPFMACDKFPACNSTCNVPEGVEVIKITPKEEYHLTHEECRARALESAIEQSKVMKSMSTSELLDLAKIFEVYIRG